MPFSQMLSSCRSACFQSDDDKNTRPASPSCPHCGGSMEWYRSEMKPDGKKQKIVHHFHCSKCGISERPSIRTGSSCA